MRPQWYCDALPLIVGGDTGASGPVLRNRMLSLLHGIFTQRPGAFAVAFPGREQLAVLPPPLTGRCAFSLPPVKTWTGWRKT